MSDDASERPEEGAPADGVGGVAEEAAKLLGALSTWARDSAAGVDLGSPGALFDEVNEHVATGAAECRYCPLCRTVHAVRELSPEVRAHLTSAASSLFHAAAEMMASLPQPGSGGAGTTTGASPASGFERIDLDGEEPEPPEAPEAPEAPEDGGSP